MRSRRRWWPWSTRSTVIVVVTTMAASVLVVLGVNASGFPLTTVNPSSSMVWVTNQGKGFVGRVNRQIDEINSTVRIKGATFDVLQDGDSVLVVDRVTNEVRPVDVANVAMTSRTGIPADAVVSFGGGVLAIADPMSGSVWAGTPESLTGLDPTTATPLLSTAPGVRVAVSTSGTVFAVAPGRDELWSVRIGPSGSPEGWTTNGEGKPIPPDPVRLEGGPLTPIAAPVVAVQSPSIDITTVGDTPVILDRGTGQVVVPGRRVVVAQGDQGILQQTGPDAEAVLIATPSALVRVPLADGDPQTVVDGMSGRPSAPVALQGCAHAAWAADRSVYAVSCGSDPARTIDVPKAGSTSTLTFRVNRSVIVLNDQATGNIWLVDADMRVISNWEEAQSQSSDEDSTSNEGDQQSGDQLTNARADCAATSAQDTDPKAEPDKFGVRPGRTTVLRVLDNDSSADCTMLAISAVDAPTGDSATVAVAESGQSLQITVPATGSGPLPTIQYTVDDGTGRTSTAAVEVTVAGADNADAPVKVRDSATVVEVGGTVSYDVLPDFRSPVGDDLTLVSAVTSTDDTVTFQPNGLVTFRDTGSAGAVKKVVDIVVSDGTSQIPGQLTIDVKAEGSTKPVPGPVAASGITGETVTAFPLRSVLSGLREPARVTAVQPLASASADRPATATAELNPLDSTVALTGSAPGTSYFVYTVAAGPATATGVIRFDVTDPPNPAAAPVVTPDVGYLVPGRTLVIDPLANDRDPMGSVLAVQSLTQPPGSPLTATVHDLSLVQVSSSRPVPAAGVTMTYTAANAVGATTGQIRVIPVPASPTPQPPVASDIQVTVRAGDAVTIPVAEHATDPTGELLTVKPFAPDTLPAGQGLVFATDGAIRYLAPATPPTSSVRFSYTVVNTDLLTDTRTVTVSVTSPDTANNAAPKEPPLMTARVFAGQTGSIQLPLNGLDPDGDWVTFAGQTDPAPVLGRIDRAGPSTVSYTALGSPGLDTAGYLVTDPYGRQAKGQLRVAVVQPPAVASPPVAPDLKVVVRPGRTVGVDALAEVSDPAGSTGITFSDPALVVPAGITAEVKDGVIVVAAPGEEGVFPIKYTARSGRGLAASGILTVTVSATAPLSPPTAKDVFVEPSMISADGSSAAVDVTASVTNRSGLVSDLTVTAGDLAVDGRRITVPVTDKRQVIAYTVTNLDQDSASAFLVVPPRAEQTQVQQQDQQQQPPPPVDDPPRPRGDVPPFEITAGETKTVPVLDYVQVAEGRSASVPPGEVPTASQGQVSRLDDTSLQYAVPATAAGSAVINVKVTDGSSAPVLVPIPVRIINPTPPPPTFSGATVNVEKGSTATQDLSGLVATPGSVQPKDMTYAVATAPSGGLSATVDGSVLTVTADTSAQRGTSSSAVVTVSDGINPPVSATIAIAVVGSTAALATVPANQQVEASAGHPVTVDVLSGAYNPFPDTPLKIDSAVASNGAAVQISGSSITVTPPSGALDQFSVAYSVSDATGDADRQVTGTLTVIPLAKPDAPTAVVATSLGKPDSVDVAWQAPALTRPAIQSFTVYWSGGQATCGADAGHCEVGPLNPGTEYTFSVSATNSEGEGPKSSPSAGITPDVEPDTPGSPTVAWAAPGSVTVSWQAPDNRGSALASYLVTASNSQQKTVAAGSTTTTFTDLDPDTEVSFTVRATNSTGKSSQDSAPSRSLYPSATTLAPTGLTLTPGKDGGGLRTITVSWDQAQKRGDPADSYLVTVNGATSTVTAPTTTYVISNVRDGQGYAVSVKARNHVGDSDSSESQSLTTSPDGADVVSATPTGQDRQITVQVAASSTAGGSISQYVVFANGTQVSTGGTTQTVTVGSNGTPYTFTAQACVGDTCSAQDGRSVSATAYGPVGPASATYVENSQTAVRFNWTVPNDNGRGPMQVRFQVDGGGWSGWGDSGTGVFGNGCAQSHNIQVQGRDSAGLEGPITNGATGNSQECPPPPRPSASTGRSGDQATLTVANFPAGRYELRCLNATDATHQWSTNYRGAVPQVSVPADGTIAITCPVPPTSGQTFSIEIYNAMWAQPTTW